MNVLRGNNGPRYRHTPDDSGAYETIALDKLTPIIGAEVSGAAWYDSVYNQHDDNNSPTTFNPVSVPNTSFPTAVRDRQGRDAELLNAFIYNTFDIDGRPLTPGLPGPVTRRLRSAYEALKDAEAAR